MHLRTISPRRRTIAVALATALFVFTLVACGSEAATDPSSTQPPTEATPTPGDPPGDRPVGGAVLPEEVTACLTDRGYAAALEAGAAQRAAARDADFQTALQECATEVGVDLPFGGGAGTAGGGRAGVDTVALAECLVSEGVETDLDAPGGPLATLDRDDPGVADALEVCGFGGRGQRPAAQ